jgi:hypothetical protein
VQGPRLRAEVDRLTATGWHVGGDRLVRVPKGHDVDDARADLLRHRSLHAGRLFEYADWLHGPAALDRVREAWRDLTALNEWLGDNVGATTREPRRR